MLLPGFGDYTLAPFTEEQVRNFVEAWYSVARIPEDQRDERKQDLKEAATTPDLFRLARNPMLLTTMALIHQTNTELPPPARSALRTGGRCPAAALAKASRAGNPDPPKRCVGR